MSSQRSDGVFPPKASEAILTLAGLGFLGFGIEPSAAAEWGYDLQRSIADVTSGIWWTSLFPGLAIVLSVLGIGLIIPVLPQLITDLAGGEAVTTECPVLGIRVSAFQSPMQALPKQDDRLSIRGALYVIREVQLDSHGGAKLLLNLTP